MGLHISDDAASLATYICTALSAIILIARLAVFRFQPNPYDISFWLVLSALIVVIARLAISYYVFSYNTVGDALIQLAKFGHFPPSETAHRLKVGSILSLVLRLLLTTDLWMMCLLLLLLYRRFTNHINWMRILIAATYVFIGLSYIAIVLTTFLECHPFHLYWQISPNPGSCIKAYAQICLQTISNIVIDLLLMGISVPILLVRAQPLAHRLKLFILVSMGVFCIVTSCLRLLYTFRSDSSQQARTFWASIQVLVASFVANSPVLYGSMTLRKRRKSTNGAYPGAGGMRAPHNPAEHEESGIYKMTAVTRTENTRESVEGELSARSSSSLAYALR